ncbi:MAG: hypothetical protein ACKVW3_01815 [Phycisphaerales bacterium]
MNEVSGPGLTATLSVARKVNLGNYESAEVFLSISGITAETTADEIDDMLQGGPALAYDALRAATKRKADALRQT